ncbi:hypothetical protein [Glycocaulis sp.]
MNRVVSTEKLMTLDVTALSATAAPLREAVPGSEVHPTVFKGMAAVYLAVLIAFWVAFQASAVTVFALGVCLVYLVMYVATPALLVRTASRRAGAIHGSGISFGEFLDAPLDTGTGPCSGRVAVIQMLLVPVSLALAAAGMAIVLMMTRAGFN